MSVTKAVKTLNADLARMKKAEAKQKKDTSAVASTKSAEKTALDGIAAQEKSLIDAFVAAPPTDPAQLQKVLGQLVTLGEKQVQTQDQFTSKLAAEAKAIAADKKSVTADKKQALKDLKPAEYELSLKATNADRKELGLKALKKPLRQTGSNTEPWKPGPGSLQAADTSMWESDSTFNASIANSKWSAIKATEGTSWVDPTFKARWDKLGQLVKSGKMKLRMAYCFLDAGQSGRAQADHFLSTLGVHGKLQPGTRLVLDWEGSALNDPGMLRDAANRIKQVTGLWPVVYVQGSMMNVAKNAVPGAPIWEAAYGSGINRGVPFFQYSDGPGYDHDVFNGSLKALEKFAGWN